jgi:hypothetical protein
MGRFSHPAAQSGHVNEGGSTASSEGLIGQPDRHVCE